MRFQIRFTSSTIPHLFCPEHHRQAVTEGQGIGSASMVCSVYPDVPAVCSLGWMEHYWRAIIQNFLLIFVAICNVFHTITNSMSIFHVVNLVLSTQWCMDVFYCSFGSPTSLNVCLAQMKNQGIEVRKEPVFLGLLSIFHPCLGLLAPRTLGVQLCRNMALL